MWQFVGTTLVAAALVVTSAPACPDGFDDLGLDNNRCYFFSEDNLTWTMSYTQCIQKMSNLVSFAEACDLYGVFYNLFSGDVDSWTGLLDIAGNKQWTDGSKYNPKLDKFFNDTDTNDIYVYLSASDGRLYHGKGTVKRAYICYVDLSPEPIITTTPEPASTTTPPPAEPCKDGWTWDQDETCYFFSKDKQYWATAAHSCHQQDAELVAVRESTDVTFLLVTAEEGVYWIGLQNENDTYIWEDGTDAENASSILDPYLDDWVEGKDCVALNQSAPFNDRFQHQSCFEQYQYICYKNATTSEIEEPLDIYEEFLGLF